ncbi:tetratricopeptide repeat protein [Oricola cellulosilytica]|uniref:tetratricopeptide repeat protein n=1 Tax=Oricola cellulosilytica TaxID=1429082 RepID=UPI001CBDCD87|nr:tetratricopeptide repeat protein [Oricola cellulosilytica]
MRPFLAVAVSILGLSLASCQGVNVEDLSTFGDSAASVENLSDAEFYATDELITMGKTQFKERNYGKSYSFFKRAVEVFPKDPAAWLGFAASADHVGRFDTADRAYRVLSTMIGRRPEYYNNVGYSYLLRGNLPKARHYFLKAYEIDPSNEITANNLELMRNSVAFAKRGYRG